MNLFAHNKWKWAFEDYNLFTNDFCDNNIETSLDNELKLGDNGRQQGNENIQVIYEFPSGKNWMWLIMQLEIQFV